MDMYLAKKWLFESSYDSIQYKPLLPLSPSPPLSHLMSKGFILIAHCCTVCSLVCSKLSLLSL